MFKVNHNRDFECGSDTSRVVLTTLWEVVAVAKVATIGFGDCLVGDNKFSMLPKEKTSTSGRSGESQVLRG